MFQVYMSSLTCDQQTDPHEDFPYVLVASVDLASSPTNPQFEVFRLGPFEDASGFETGSTYLNPMHREDPDHRKIRTFWGSTVACLPRWSHLLERRVGLSRMMPEWVGVKIRVTDRGQIACLPVYKMPLIFKSPVYARLFFTAVLCEEQAEPLVEVSLV